MSRDYILSIILTIALLLVGTTVKLSAQQTSYKGYHTVPGEIIVKFKSNPQVRAALDEIRGGNQFQRGDVQASRLLGIMSVDRLSQDFNVQKIEPLVSKPQLRKSLKGIHPDHSMQPDLLTLVKVKLNDPVDLETAIQAYNSDPNVVYAEPNYIYSIGETIPDDPRFDEQWAFNNTGQTGGTEDADIDAPEAWEIQKGESSVIVGVIDTGIDWDHPDLAANMWINNDEIPNNGIDDDGNGYADDIHGWDFINNDNDPMDDNGHGTHTAGTVGAVSDNGVGVAGTAWYVRLMALKFLGAGGRGSTDDAVEALYYAANNGARVTNNSWGGGGPSKALKDAIRYAESVGSLFVAAAGNGDTDEPHYPSFYQKAFAVASTDHEDKKSGFSNFGNWVDISAPGSSILSTVWDDDYASYSGTSMATPHVAGLAALLFAEHQDWTPQQVRIQIETTAENIDGLNPDYVGKLGTGRINAHQALLPPEPRLKIAEIFIDDDQFDKSFGNLDGVANADESLEIRLTLRNVGAIRAESVEARIRSSSEYVTLVDTVASYGEVESAGGTSHGEQPFLVKISPDTPTGARLKFSLFITEGSGLSWMRDFEIKVYSRSMISGRVTDVATGKGIPYVRVAYEGLLSDFVLTDENGDYKINNLLDGEYLLSASHSEYLTKGPILVTVPPAQSDVNVQLGVAIISVAPDRFDLALDWNISSSHSLSISNLGQESLIYDIFELPNRAGKTSLSVQAAEYDETLLRNLTYKSSEILPIAPGVEPQAPDSVSQLPPLAEMVERWTATTSTVELIPTIRAAVLRSWGSRGAQETFDHLNANWRDHGPIPILIDYVTLNKDDITYQDLVDSKADVLIVSDAWNAEAGWEFTQKEQGAIRRYLDENKGIIVTSGTLDSENAPGHVPFFAELLGFDSTKSYDWAVRRKPSYELVAKSPLFRQTIMPYLPGTALFCSPEEGHDWRDATVKAIVVAASSEYEAIVSTFGKNVYISNILEVKSNRSDFQLLYNATLFAGADVPWLSVSEFEGGIEPQQQKSVGLKIETRSLLPVKKHESELLITSNDLNTPTIRVPVSVSIAEAAVVELTSFTYDDDRSGESFGDGDGTPAAGERIELNITIANKGNINASGVTVRVSSSISTIAFVRNQVQVGDLSANSEVQISSAVVFDIDSDTPDGEQAWLIFDLADNSDNTRKDSVKVELRRFTVVSGSVTAASTAQPVEGATVHYSGPYTSETTTNTSGEYNLKLGDGDYEIWVESNDFLRSEREFVTLPFGQTIVDFELRKPNLGGLPQQLSVEIEGQHTETITLSNSGDAPLRYYFLPSHRGTENVAFESQVQKVAERYPILSEDRTTTTEHSSEPVASTSYTGNHSFGRVALFMDQNPWGSPANQDILSAHNIPFDILNSGLMGNVDLSQYTKVVTASAQPNAFWDALFANKGWFDEYLENGGVLELHTANFNNFYVSGKEFPGGLVVKTEFTDDVDVESEVHPIVNEPSSINSEMLDKWRSSAHGYFEKLPEDALTIIVHAGNLFPATVEILRGEGVIIATQQTVEWHRAEPKFLENMLLFGLQDVPWMTAQPFAGLIPPGEKSQIEIQFSDETLLPGDTRQGKLRVYNNVPNAMVLDVPVVVQVKDAPALTIESFKIQDSENGDNDGILESGEGVDFAVTFKNVGTVKASNLSATLSPNVGDVTVIRPSFTIDELSPGRVSQEILYPVQVSEEVADSTLVHFVFDLTGDNNFTQTVELPEIAILSDKVAPGPITNLEVVSVTRSSVVLFFIVTGDDDTEGRAAEYDLRYSESPINADNFTQAIRAPESSVPKPAGRADTLIVNGLEPNKRYYFALGVKDDAGNASQISNVVSSIPEIRLQITSMWVADYPPDGSGDNKVGPGEQIRVRFEVQNKSQGYLSGVYAIPDTSFDPYFYSNPAYYWRREIRGGDIAPSQETFFWFNFFVNSNMPGGHVLKIPLAYYDGNDILVDVDTLSFPTSGNDKFPPEAAWGDAYPKRVTRGVEVELFAFIMEPGPITSVEAIIEHTDGNEIARVHMKDDGKEGDREKNDRWYYAKWLVTQTNDFYLRVFTADPQGNSGVSRELSGFSSKPFEKSSDLLAVYDDRWHFAEQDYTNYILGSFQRLGMGFDFWNIYFRDEVPEEILNQYQDGTVFWFMPIYGTLDFGKSQQKAVRKYMDKGGSIFIAGQVLAERLVDKDPKLLSEYLGAILGAPDIDLYGLNGIDDDILGNGLVLSIRGTGGADNQWNQSGIDPVTDAIPFLRYDPRSRNTNLSTSSVANPKSLVSLSQRIGVLESFVNHVYTDQAEGFLQYIEYLKERLYSDMHPNGNRIASAIPGVDPNTSSSDPLGHYGGIRYEADGHRSVFLSFGFEAITSPTVRDSLIARSVRWLQFEGNDVIPPANVTDLSASLASSDFVEVKWTAPGDDGRVGRAAKYDLRYATRPPSDNMDNWWENANRIDDEPEPLPADSIQYYRLNGVTANTNYYFMLKTSDEFSNVSGFSNLAIVTTTGPPQIQVDTSSVSMEINKGGSLSTEVIIKNSGVGTLSFEINFEIPSTPSSASARKNFFILDHEKTKIAFRAFTYEITDEFAITRMSADDFRRYSVLYIEPTWINLANLRAILPAIETFVYEGGVVVLNVSKEDWGDLEDIDFLGTDVSMKRHYSLFIEASQHPFITGRPYGGQQLRISDFNRWSPRDWGHLKNIPASATVILRNDDGPCLIEYPHNAGKVLLTTLNVGDDETTTGIKPLENLAEYALYLANQYVPWYQASVTSGTVPTNDSLSVNLIFNTSQLSLGVHRINFLVISNDPDKPEIRKRLELMVNPPTSVDEKKPVEGPRSFALFQNYPNPFNPETIIRFDLPQATHVRLSIYNLLGRRIRVLIDEGTEAGFHKVSWDGLDHNGSLVPSGMYIYHIEAGEFEKSMKMIVLR